MIEDNEITMETLSDVAGEFRRHFDQYYLGVIPRLLNEEGMFLAFVSMIGALETLAGIFEPKLGTGDRFRSFVTAFFPPAYNSIISELWQFRNRMVHSFNPSPFLITCHNSRMHLKDVEGIIMLNAEDFYADVVIASRGYFSALYENPIGGNRLQENFSVRISHKDGGRPKSSKIVEHLNGNL
jgi:hypothetical protein